MCRHMSTDRSSRRPTFSAAGLSGSRATDSRSRDFSRYKTLADIGGATGQLSSIVAARHSHMQCRTCDLADVQQIAERRLREHDVGGRVTAETIDFFADEFPKADVITMGMILHDWNLEKKKILIAK